MPWCSSCLPACCRDPGLPAGEQPVLGNTASSPSALLRQHFPSLSLPYSPAGTQPLLGEPSPLTTGPAAAHGADCPLWDIGSTAEGVLSPRLLSACPGPSHSGGASSAVLWAAQPAGNPCVGDALGRGLSLTRHIHPLQERGGATKGGQAGHPCMVSQKGSCHQPMAVGSSGHKPWRRGPSLAPWSSAALRATGLGKVSAEPGSLSEKTRKGSFTLNPGKPVYFHCILILRDCLPRPRLSHGKEKPGSVTRGETCPRAKFPTPDVPP